MFEHFVITRFNLKLESHFQNDKNGNITQTDTWLKRRFELFETYCFPSLYAQSCAQFKWLVLFDIDTPITFKKKINTYRQTFSNFHPLYLESGETEYLRHQLIDAISLLADDNVQSFITTRIDNDDAFHKDMIKEVQLFFSEKKEDGFLNFNYGIQYDVNKCCAVRICYEKNHFLSRFEKRSTLETVIAYDHTQVDKVAEVFEFENKANPLWIEVIHNSNISNELQISMPIFSSGYFNRFNLKLEISKKDSFRILLMFVKKNIYEFLAVLFKKIGLFKTFKKIIKFWK